MHPLFAMTPYHGRNVQELFISSSSRVVRVHNLCQDAAPVITSVLQANNIMLPVSAWSLHEQFGGAPAGHEASIWCVFRTHDDACRALRVNGARGIAVSTALEDDLKPFTKLRRFELQDEMDSLHINFNLAPGRAPSPSVLYSSRDDYHASSPTKNTGYWTPPTPTTALSSCGSSSEGTSPPSSTLSLFGANSGFTMSTNPPSPRSAFKRGDWICSSPACASHNFGRNALCIACALPRPAEPLAAKPASDYDRYFDQRAPLPLSPPPPRRCNPPGLPLLSNAGPVFPPTPAPSLPPTFAASHRATHPPRLPSILTPSGRAFARGGRIQNVSPVPAAPLVIFWPDNEPLPQSCQIRPPFSPGTHPPIMNTGNRGPVEHQPGDWYCGKCSYMNWRRRKVCQTCFPFADGNADGVSPAVQAERINALAQIAGSGLANLELLEINSKLNDSGLGLNFGPKPPALDTLTASFASMNVSDRRGSVDHVGRVAPAHSLRTRQSDAGLRFSAPFATRPRASDAGLARVNALPDLTFGLPSLGARRVSDGNIWATGDGPNAQGRWPTYPFKA